MLLARRLRFLEERGSGSRVQGSGEAKRKEPRASARAVASYHGTSPSDIAISSAPSVVDPFEPTLVTSGSGRCTQLILPAVLTLLMGAGIAQGGLFADHVVSFVPGAGGESSDPQVTLGEPARFIPGDYGGAVTMINPPYLPTQIASIGTGGALTVSFDQPITDDPGHMYGRDLIVFGYSFFWVDFPSGQFYSPAALYTSGVGKLEVSADGVNFFEVPGALATQLFPTQGYVDAGPFDPLPGTVPTDFHKPVNPALALSSFDGLSYAQAVALYEGSGGGMSVDIGAAVDSEGHPAGLTSVSYVRVTNLGDKPLSLDAFSVVPEPMTAVLLPLALAAFGLRRTRR